MTMAPMPRRSLSATNHSTPPASQSSSGAMMRSSGRKKYMASSTESPHRPEPTRSAK